MYDYKIIEELYKHVGYSHTVVKSWRLKEAPGLGFADGRKIISANVADIYKEFTDYDPETGLFNKPRLVEKEKEYNISLPISVLATIEKEEIYEEEITYKGAKLLFKEETYAA